MGTNVVVAYVNISVVLVIIIPVATVDGVAVMYRYRFYLSSHFRRGHVLNDIVVCLQIYRPCMQLENKFYAVHAVE